MRAPDVVRLTGLTGGDSNTVREANQVEQPAAPPGSTCDYAMAEGFGSVFRFCFKDGKLVQKDEIERQ